MDRLLTTRNVILALKLALFTYLGYLIYFLASGYHPEVSWYRPPFIIFVFDTINLYIHETGHLLARPFGMFIHVLGGSLFQVLLPLALLIVTWRQTAYQIPYSMFWVGESMVNVSAYIRDAPFKRLHLINPNLLHDWRWLLRNHFDWAEPMADITWLIGVLVCSSAVVLGIIFTIRTFLTKDAVTTS